MIYHEDDKKLSWHNYVTGETDYREMPTTDDEAVQYIPQAYGAGPGLYRILRMQGDSIGDAMKNVLSAAIGER